MNNTNATAISLADKLKTIRAIEAAYAASDLDFEESKEFSVWGGLRAELHKAVDIKTPEDAVSLIDYAIEEFDAVDFRETVHLFKAVSDWITRQAA